MGTSWGTGGAFVYDALGDVAQAGTVEAARAVVVQSDGRIVLVGAAEAE